jgi:hypothetical protein
MVTPALFWKFGRQVAENVAVSGGESAWEEAHIRRLAAQFDSPVPRKT